MGVGWVREQTLETETGGTDRVRERWRQKRSGNTDRQGQRERDRVRGRQTDRQGDGERRRQELGATSLLTSLRTDTPQKLSPGRPAQPWTGSTRGPG